MIFQRIKNLWRMSEYRPLEVGESTSDLPNGTKVVGSIVNNERNYPKGDARVIDINSPVDEDFPEEKDI